MARRRGAKKIVIQQVREKVVQKSRRRRARPNRNKASKTTKGKGSPAYELACSLAKPFECSACIPDGTRGKGCFSLKATQSITTGVGGSSAAFLWQPDVNNCYFVANAQTTATPAVTGSWHANQAVSAVTAQYATWRPISAGVKASYTGPTQTDGGTILIGQVASGTPPSTFNGATMDVAAQSCEYFKTYPLRNGGVAYWRPDDMDDMMQFLDTPSSAVTASTVRPYLVVLVYGAATNQAVIQIEAIANFEGKYSNQNFIPGGVNESGPEAVEPGWFEKAQMAISKLAPLAPLIGSAMDVAMPGSKMVLGTLGNGLQALGLLGKSSRN